jgi:hypothetical protein
MSVYLGLMTYMKTPVDEGGNRRQWACKAVVQSGYFRQEYVMLYTVIHEILTHRVYTVLYVCIGRTEIAFIQVKRTLRRFSRDFVVVYLREK